MLELGYDDVPCGRTTFPQQGQQIVGQDAEFLLGVMTGGQEYVQLAGKPGSETMSTGLASFILEGSRLKK